MNFEGFVLFDGAMGTVLQNYAHSAGELPELLNLTDPELVTEIHKSYVLAGADVISTNTFGANAYKMGNEYNVPEIVTAAVNNAKSSGAKHIALDIGPTGAILEPFGELSFESAYDIFCEQISAGVKAGVDCIIIETMSDLLEAKAAIIAAKDCCSLPVIASMSYIEGGRTFLGTDVITATITLCSLGASAVGANCSLGPEDMVDIISDILKYSTVPVIVQANAGIPKVLDGITSFPVTAALYNDFIKTFINMGVTVLGGCCGTTPEYTELMRETIDRSKLKDRIIKPYTAFTSGRKSIILKDDEIAVIGERINPTGKEKLTQSLISGDYSYAVDEALTQEDCGVDLLDVNAGLADIDEPAVLRQLVKEIQAVTTLPLLIDSVNETAISEAVRVYNGKPIINSVNGKAETLEAILPIAAKYGTAIAALTLDDNGIPKTAEERFLIAKRILVKALDYGIKKEDVIIDCLTKTIATDQAEIIETLKA
ncbi:MAG TPA: homocysteine S-methyltransferase family protein, partial [Clostridia bacterium]|nr:homocysteine S-methyltransferase family protein [Clostridia bacterium]